MSNNANYLFENFFNEINQTLDKYAPEILNQSISQLPNEDCQVWLCCERKLWSENNSKENIQ